MTSSRVHSPVDALNPTSFRSHPERLTQAECDQQAASLIAILLIDSFTDFPTIEICIG